MKHFTFKTLLLSALMAVGVTQVKADPKWNNQWSECNQVNSTVNIADMWVANSNMFENSGTNIGAVYGVNNTINCGSSFHANVHVLYKGDYKMTFDCGNGMGEGKTGHFYTTLKNSNNQAISSKEAIANPNTGNWVSFNNHLSTQSYKISTAGYYYVCFEYGWNDGYSTTPDNMAIGTWKNFKFVKTAGYVTYNYNDGGATASQEVKVNIGDALSTPLLALATPSLVGQQPLMVA